jgi:predicted nucleic acid-binding protein
LKILIDTGVLLRLFEPHDPLFPVANAAIQRIDSRGDQASVTWQNLAEFWSVATRPATARGGFGLSALMAEQRLNLIRNTFAVLPEHFTAIDIWQHLIVTFSVLGKQVHDARLAALMMASGVTDILTFNVADFARFSSLTVHNPATMP